MISIIAAVHNQLGMNKLFVETIKKYTHHKYELVIIDNCSTDGSREFYRAHADVLIENDKNYSYSYCQNQGIEAASYDKLAFLNNDLIVSPNWDKRIVEIQNIHELDIISFASNDRLESVEATRRLRNSWKRIKNPLQLISTSTRNLKLMHRLMYGNWISYCQNRYNKFEDGVKEGFSGSCIFANRAALAKLNNWDKRIISADFDLYCKTKKRYLEVGDIKPIHIALGVFMHHYTRLTFKSNYPPFADKDDIITFKEKWGDEAERLLVDVEH